MLCGSLFWFARLLITNCPMRHTRPLSFRPKAHRSMWIGLPCATSYITDVVSTSQRACLGSAGSRCGAAWWRGRHWQWRLAHQPPLPEPQCASGESGRPEVAAPAALLPVARDSEAQSSSLIRLGARTQAPSQADSDIRVRVWSRQDSARFTAKKHGAD